MNDWLDDEFDDVPGETTGAETRRNFSRNELDEEQLDEEQLDEEQLDEEQLDEEQLDEEQPEDEQFFDELSEDEDFEEEAPTGEDRDFERIFAAAAAAVAQTMAAPLIESEDDDDVFAEAPSPPLHVVPRTGRPPAAPPRPAPSVAVPAPPPHAATAAAPPRPLIIRDKTLTYLNLPVFEEFASLATLYGELLALRYREVRLPADLQELVTRYPDTLHLVAVVTEGDPDTAAVLPIVARLVDASVRLDMRIVEDEDEESLRPLALLLPDMDMTAVLEEWDLPQIIVFDEDWEVQAQWGPRPTAADARVEAWLAANPDYETLAGDESLSAIAAHAELTHTLLYEMRVWYNSGLNRACLDEWRDLLTGLLPADEPEAAGER